MSSMTPGEARSAAGGFDDQCFFGFAAFLASSVGRPTLHVAVVGKDKKPVLEGFRACPGTHVVLLHSRADSSRARKLRDTLCSGGVPTRTHPIPPDPFTGVLAEASAILHEARLEYADVYLNVGSGTPAAGCALTTAAYLHGAKAFHVVGDAAVLLPVLPYNHRDALSPTKVAILRALAAAHGHECSPRALAAAVLTADELDHHLRGEPGRKGLIGLGLVEERRRFGGNRLLRLTGTGIALMVSGLLAPHSPTV
jgi:DNA-binding transcriptional ArsR family regulator